MAEEKPQADVVEQAKEPTGGIPAAAPEMPDRRAESSEADALEQSVVVEEEQVLAPEGSRETAAEGDWLEQSIEESSEEEDRR